MKEGRYFEQLQFQRKRLHIILSDNFYCSGDFAYCLVDGMIYVNIPWDSEILKRFSITTINGKKYKVVNYIGHDDPKLIVLECYPHD